LTERCSAISLALDEPLEGTASTIRSWILLEAPGPWGADALTSSRLPEAVRGPLRERAAAAGVRVLLIRRVGRSAAGVRRAYVVHTGPGRPWAERAELGDPEDLLTIDLEGLALGRRPGFGAPETGPIHVVCTHGRRDPCCAERGRPLAAALAADRPETVWESSHIGGDRFAGNLVCFPHGLYFGRVDPAEAAGIASAYERGTVALGRYRGRSCYGFAVQAAEAHLREHGAVTGVDAITLAGVSRSGARVEARFGVEGRGTVLVRVRVGRGEPRPLTCHALDPAPPRTFTVEAVEAVDTA
jgi:hypothetical protein